MNAINGTFSLLIYVKKSKMISNGTVPIYFRITINGARVEFSSKCYVLPESFNVTAQKLDGCTQEVRKINRHLKVLEQKVFDIYRQLIEYGKPITSEKFKQYLSGIPEKSNTKLLCAVFKEHNEQIAALVGREYSKGTVERYTTSLKHTIAFMQWKYKVSDMDVQLINHEFVTSYEFYLRTVRNCNNNSAVKYVKNFGKIMRICLANGWITIDPFLKYKSKMKKVDRPFLNNKELESLAAKSFSIDRLELVRDIFLFCCFTGLAYVDVKALKRADIRIGVDGEKWIFIRRTKTDTPASIPLLPTALQIMKRYERHPFSIENDCLLPVLSNQKMNAYLKEVADVCGIEKPMTFHVARHTFATTVTLLNGVPIESVSKMLGHTNIQTTQHYAKVLDIKVSEDMALLKRKISSK